MKFRFTVEDFEPHPEASELADRSNFILDAHLKSLPVVAQIEVHEDVWFLEKELEEGCSPTHRAYLFDVEPITNSSDISSKLVGEESE